jgi:hypothetical protein
LIAASDHIESASTTVVPDMNVGTSIWVTRVRLQWSVISDA